MCQTLKNNCQKIENNCEEIFANFPREHVDRYVWLRENLHKRNIASCAEYQKKYRGYWVMRYIAPTSEFAKKYFDYLEKHKNNKKLTFLQAAKDLSDLTTDSKGQQKSYQFSFISKLVHMVNNKSPIFDSQVKKFYKLPNIPQTTTQEKREKSLLIMDILHKGQRKILSEKLLDKSISQFRQKFSDSGFSDEKIIDSIIWHYSAPKKDA